jgi:hypothetical protein
MAIESRFGLPMSSMMIRGNGTVRMETKTENLTPKGSCTTVMRASTMCGLTSPNGYFTGLWGGAPMSTRD